MKTNKNIKSITDMGSFAVEKFYDAQIRAEAFTGNANNINKLMAIKKIMIKVAMIKEKNKQKAKLAEKEKE